MPVQMLQDPVQMAWAAQEGDRLRAVTSWL